MQDITRLTRKDAIAESIFLGLRLSEGVRFDRFEQQFGERLEIVRRDQILKLEKAGLLDCGPERMALTRKGMLLSNRVFVEFL